MEKMMDRSAEQGLQGMMDCDYLTLKSYIENNPTTPCKIVLWEGGNFSLEKLALYKTLQQCESFPDAQESIKTWAQSHPASNLFVVLGHFALTYDQTVAFPKARK